MKTEKRPLIILILGSMTALSPFSIDMYLPSFAQIAADLNSTPERISLSLSSYFIGLAIGQLFYGPLLDRYGRKPPLYIGLLVYVAASLGCIFAPSADSLIFLRLIQALGGCVAGVAAMAMVRDLFPPHEGAKVFSLLILILGVSPLLAPTFGGYLTEAFGWRMVFATLALIAGLVFAAVRLKLPESHQPDHSVSLRLLPIFRDFLTILKDPRFNTYAVSGAVAFSGLFVYLAGSSMIFMEGFAVGPRGYGWIFAIIASGMIIASQLNVVLLGSFTNRQLLVGGLTGQVLVGTVFFILSTVGWLNLISTVALFFLFMSCFGITNPNSMSLSLASFSKNAGRASALMGFLQMALGATASALVGLLGLADLTSVVGILAASSALGLIILFIGQKRLAGSRSHV